MNTVPAGRGIGVAIVAPSGYAPDENALARASGYFESLGCIVRQYYDPAAKHQRFGGSDTARVAQLHQAAADPAVQIVLALRGGYGMSRLLDQLDFKRLAASGKLFVGHSDFTAFQLGLLAVAGGVSFSGPMVCDDFARPAQSRLTLESFWQCLTEPEYALDFPSSGAPPLDVSGTLWGGNLSMVAHLAGTRYLPQIQDGILFLEDVNEHPYRVERMLLQLMHAGVLARQQAVLLGDFSGYKLNAYDNGYDFDGMLAYLRERLGLPVLAGLPFGHMPDKVTLPVGSRSRVVSGDGHCQLFMSGHPVLSAAR